MTDAEKLLKIRKLLKKYKLDYEVVYADREMLDSVFFEELEKIVMEDESND